MENFLKKYDALICKIWNAFYDFLCEKTGVEVDERWYIETIFQ